MPVPTYFKKLADPAAKRQVTASSLVLVEGQDDLWFFDALLEEMGADPQEIQILDYGSNGALEMYLANFLKQNKVQDGDVTGVLVTGDADAMAAKTIYDITRLCKKQGLGDLEQGRVASKAGALIKKVGLYVLPGGGRDGNLETLLLGTVSADQAVIDARAFVESHHITRSPINDKRVAQAYLSTREELSRGAGMGAKRKYFNMSHTELDNLKNCIREIM